MCFCYVGFLLFRCGGAVVTCCLQTLKCNYSVGYRQISGLLLWMTYFDGIFGYRLIISIQIAVNKLLCSHLGMA
jgi:hypothetical protein